MGSNKVSGNQFETVAIRFSLDELAGLSNVINEVIGWVTEADCETRIGLTITELHAMQTRVNLALKEEKAQ